MVRVRLIKPRDKGLSLSLSLAMFYTETPLISPAARNDRAVIEEEIEKGREMKKIKGENEITPLNFGSGSRGDASSSEDEDATAPELR